MENGNNLNKIFRAKHSEKKPNKNVKTNFETKREGVECCTKNISTPTGLIRGSMIPVMKKNELKYNKDKCCKNEYEKKLKELEEKEKSIAKHYENIEELLKKIHVKKSAEKITLQTKSNSKLKVARKKNILKNRVARKMISDPLVFDKNKSTNFCIEIENGVHQISKIWLKTSTEVLNTLQNINKGSSLSPIHYKAEKIKIQKAMKKAKSFTVLKTKSVIAEALKYLAYSRSNENESNGIDKKEILQPEGKKVENDSECNSIVRVASSCYIKEIKSNDEKIVVEKKIGNSDNEENINMTFNNAMEFSEKSEEHTRGIAHDEHYKIIPDKLFERNVEKDYELSNPLPNLPKEVEFWKEGVTKNTKSIILLKSKIFDLQKACNEYSIKCNELQLKLVNFSENIYLDEVFYKKMQGAQFYNHNQSTEEHFKGDYDFKNADLHAEAEILLKLKTILYKEKLLLNDHKKYMENPTSLRADTIFDYDKAFDFNNLKVQYATAQRINGEKRNIIEKLKGIVEIMKNQEELVINQHATIRAKIEEYKKLQKNNSNIKILQNFA